MKEEVSMNYTQTWRQMLNQRKLTTGQGPSPNELEALRMAELEARYGNQNADRDIALRQQALSQQAAQQAAQQQQFQQGLDAQQANVGTNAALQREGYANQQGINNANIASQWKLANGQLDQQRTSSLISAGLQAPLAGLATYNLGKDLGFWGNGTTGTTAGPSASNDTPGGAFGPASSWGTTLGNVGRGIASTAAGIFGGTVGTAIGGPPGGLIGAPLAKKGADYMMNLFSYPVIHPSISTDELGEIPNMPVMNIPALSDEALSNMYSGLGKAGEGAMDSPAIDWSNVLGTDPTLSPINFGIDTTGSMSDWSAAVDTSQGLAGMSGGDSGGGDGFGCIIVSAAHGRDSEEVNITREFRDKYMDKESLRGYYAIAERVVPKMETDPTIMDEVKHDLVDKLIDFGAYKLGKKDACAPESEKVSAEFLAVCKKMGEGLPVYTRINGERI
jgi:hypothetical protein